MRGGGKTGLGAGRWGTSCIPTQKTKKGIISALGGWYRLG